MTAKLAEYERLLTAAVEARERGDGPFSEAADAVAKFESEFAAEWVMGLRTAVKWHPVEVATFIDQLALHADCWRETARLLNLAYPERALRPQADRVEHSVSDLVPPYR